MLHVSHMLLLVAATSSASHSPCKPNCEYTNHWHCCGFKVATPGLSGSQCACPPSLSFAAGFDSFAVLQRAPSKASVYGETISMNAEIEVTITSSNMSSYTVRASTTPMSAPIAVDGGANYSASWKALLRPTAPGGNYTITARCVNLCGTEFNGTKDTARDVVVIDNVTFGDVFICGGQSNMALPLHHTFGGVALDTAARTSPAGGKFDRLRLFTYGGMSSSEKSFAPVWTRAQTHSDVVRFNATTSSWLTARAAAHLPLRCHQGTPGFANCSKPTYNPLLSFSAACVQFGRELIDALAQEPKSSFDVDVPIGLIQIAVGGTRIESWSPNETTAGCANATGAGSLYYGMITPFVNTTVRGFVWYQGENNMGNVVGNAMRGEGYGCMQYGLVRSWREIWSAVEGTTAPLAPFGVVTIAPHGAEGAEEHLSAFRWSQTANYGVLPNELMPNTFLAQAYDLGDIWADEGKTANPSCSTNVSIAGLDTCSSGESAESLLLGAAQQEEGHQRATRGLCCKCGALLADPTRCDWNSTLSEWNTALRPLAPTMRNSSETKSFMGPIHPRVKRPVGRRLAAALVALSYGGVGAVSGPTISGCSSTVKSLTVCFNASLLRGEHVVVTQGRNSSSTTGGVGDGATMRVCTGDARDCTCLSWGKVDRHSTTHNTPWCEIPAASATPRPPQPSRADIWWETPITLRADGLSLDLDLSVLNASAGAIYAVRFGWAFGGGECCASDSLRQGIVPCIPGKCGIFSAKSFLPANPFFAIIDNGHCVCTPPQRCGRLTNG